MKDVSKLTTDELLALFPKKEVKSRDDFPMEYIQLTPSTDGKEWVATWKIVHINNVEHNHSSSGATPSEALAKCYTQYLTPPSPDPSRVNGEGEKESLCETSKGLNIKENIHGLFHS